MLKKVLFIFLVLICSFTKAQTDSSAKTEPTAVPTPTVKPEKTESAPPSLGDVFKPKISLGAGMLSFHGDLYSKHYQAPWTARLAYDLNISQRLFKSVQLNFNIFRNIEFLS